MDTHTSRVVVRPYSASDWAHIRRLCCETADRGEPVERFFPEREVFADLVLAYYTDYEPEATWVAESEGQVIGYLTGCLNHRRYWRLMIWCIIPQAVLKALGRGLLFSGQTWLLLGAGLQTVLGGGFWRDVPLHCYPAHLHVNVQQGFRGQRVGCRLVEQFCKQMKAAHLAGVHAAVRQDNAAACAFFERMGFTLLSRHPVIQVEDGVHRLGYTRIYGKRV